MLSADLFQSTTSTLFLLLTFSSICSNQKWVISKSTMFLMKKSHFSNVNNINWSCSYFKSLTWNMMLSNVSKNIFFFYISTSQSYVGHVKLWETAYFPLSTFFFKLLEMSVPVTDKFVFVPIVFELTIWIFFSLYHARKIIFHFSFWSTTIYHLFIQLTNENEVQSTACYCV